MNQIVKFRFWGTSDGGGVPKAFCRCRVCQYAREHGGKDLRTRSSFRVDEKVMIDIGSDFIPQGIIRREDLFDVEHVLYTHTHIDHFEKTVPFFRWIVEEQRQDKILNMYFSEEAFNYAESVFDKNSSWHKEDFIRLHKLEYGKEYEIDKYKVVPLKGRHVTKVEAFSTNYLFKLPSGKNMYYALDSGYFLDETFEYLKNVALDAIVLECSAPVENLGKEMHMDFTTISATLERLKEQGTVNVNTKAYLSHIGAHCRTHDEIEEYWAERNNPCEVIVAYDGLAMDI